MNNNITISIDLAKEVFQVAVFNRAGKVISNKKMSEIKKIIILGGGFGGINVLNLIQKKFKKI